MARIVKTRAAGMRIAEGQTLECPQWKDEVGDLHAVAAGDPLLATGSRVRVFAGITQPSTAWLW